VMIGGVGILLAVVLSTVALVISASRRPQPSRSRSRRRVTRSALSSSSRASQRSAPSAVGRATR
jgi:hypothetical protein